MNIVMYVTGDGAATKAAGTNLTVVQLQPGQPIPEGKLVPNIPKPPEVKK